MSGLRFGRLVVLHLGKKTPKNTYWTCKCDCGKTKDVWSASLRNGETKSCGCLRTERLFKNLQGKRFGKLLVLEPTTIGGSGTKWKCKCDCGVIKEIRGSSLRSRNMKSCGCLNIRSIRKSDQEIELSALKRYLRNLHQGSKTSKRRATLPIAVTIEDLSKQWVKQRGICPYTGWKMYLRSWRSYTSPYQASLDRIDSSRGYTPDNIQFVALIANYAKNSFDEEHLVRFCKSVVLKYSDSRRASREELNQIEQNLLALESMKRDEDE